MGLADWFSDFHSNLQVRDGGTISLRYKVITRRLNLDFRASTSNTSNSLYVGSYGRGTAIQGFSDLDMLFELPPHIFERYDQHKHNGQSALLRDVRSSLLQTYSNSRISGDGQIVAITFSDGITFEVVPVFLNKAGDYTHPNSNAGGSWRRTNPKAEIDAIRHRNTVCNHNLIRLCRMMRAWKRRWNVPISGLLIDTLAYQFIEHWPHRHRSYLHYDYMCRDFFDFMRNQPKDQRHWRAPGSGQYVHRKGLFHWKATRCYNLACVAIAYETAIPKRTLAAKLRWRKIFGPEFPLQERSKTL